MIKQKLQAEQLVALKAGNQEKLTTLRYILAQIQNKEIEKNPPAGGDLTDEEIISVLKKIAKELKESIAAFEKGGRKDLVEQYTKQLDIVSPYLPKEISDEELTNAIKELMEKNKELYEKNSKAIIGVCMKELRSKADPSRILQVLKTIESSK